MNVLTWLCTIVIDCVLFALIVIAIISDISFNRTFRDFSTILEIIETITKK